MEKVRSAQEGRAYLTCKICEYAKAAGIIVEDLTWRALLPNRDASEPTVTVNGHQNTYPPIGHDTLEFEPEHALDHLARRIASDFHPLKRGQTGSPRG